MGLNAGVRPPGEARSGDRFAGLESRKEAIDRRAREEGGPTFDEIVGELSAEAARAGVLPGSRVPPSSLTAEASRRESPRAPDDLEFSLPWPPTAGQEWRAVPTGERSAKLVLSVDAKQFRRDVALELMAQRVPILRIAHPCAMHIFAQGPSHKIDGSRIGARAYDVGNLEKATLDALKHANVFEDDRWVDDLRIMRGEQIKRGRLYIRIRKLEGQA